MARKKHLIANLPSGIGIAKSHSGRGRLFYRVRLGSRYTGGQILKKDFNSVEEARVWIFGGAQSHKSKHFVPRTSDGKASKPTPNLLAGNTLPKRLNQVWTGDIRKHPLPRHPPAGWLPPKHVHSLQALR